MATETIDAGEDPETASPSMRFFFAELQIPGWVIQHRILAQDLTTAILKLHDQVLARNFIEFICRGAYYRFLLDSVSLVRVEECELEDVSEFTWRAVRSV